MNRLLAFGRGQQGAGAGSLFIGGSFVVAGVLTFAFQGISMRALGGPAGYAPVALLWNATFLVVQVLWVAGTQTLGRHVAEREARGEDWAPVVGSVRRWQVGVLVVFLIAMLPLSPLLTARVFGDAWLTAAFVAAVALYAPEYFRRGIFNGHRQSARMGAQIVAEALSRVALAVGLLLVGVGVAGPALAIILAPVIGVLAVRPAQPPRPAKPGGSFSTGKALRFAAPVLACMACAQALASGGVILVGLLGGTQAQVGLFGAALVFTRIPQYVLSPVVGALLPHASRALSLGGGRALDRFALRSVGFAFTVGVLMIGGAWLFGEWGLRLFGGARFDADASLLATLAALAAFYLLSETISQVLFALERSRSAAAAWAIGLVAATVLLPILTGDVVEAVARALAFGALAAALAQAAFYLVARRSSGARARS